MGIDYKVEINFTCNDSSIDGIVKARHFVLNITNPDEEIYNSISSTNLKNNKELKKYTGTSNSLEYQEHLWYNPKTREAIYWEFSL